MMTRFLFPPWLALTGIALALAACEQRHDGSSGTTPSAAASSPVPSIAGAATDVVSIPAGKFMMGDKDEVDAPPHEVSVSAFLMDKHLITQDQFQKLMGTNPSRWKGGQNPVEQLRWSDAANFSRRHSRAERPHTGSDAPQQKATLRC